MNWKVRFRNPVFWVQIVVSAFAAVLAYAGLNCLFLVLSSMWNAVNDPTTKGVADSERARQYTIPQK